MPLSLKVAGWHRHPNNMTPSVREQGRVFIVFMALNSFISALQFSLCKSFPCGADESLGILFFWILLQVKLLL